MFEKFRVVVVVPAYNEERFIGSVVLKIKRYQVQVIVVDDGSSDDTALLAELAGATVLKLEKNTGKAGALNAGFALARTLDPDVIVMLDADAQHRPEELPAIITPVVEGDADLVIGSRYLSKTSKTPVVRRWGHRLINLLTGISSGRHATDSQSGFRAFSRKAIDYCRFSSEGFSVESEMQFLAQQHNLRLVEVPITVQYLDAPKRSAFQQGLRVLAGIIKLTGQYRPLLFFGLPGFVLLLAGIGWGVFVIERFLEIGELAVGYAMICVLLCVIGMVLMTTGITLHSVRGLLQEMLVKKGK